MCTPCGFQPVNPCILDYNIIDMQCTDLMYITLTQYHICFTSQEEDTLSCQTLLQTISYKEALHLGSFS